MRPGPARLRPAPLLALAALPWLAGCERAADARRTPPPPTVGVVEARTMDVPEEVEPNGTTRALKEVSIRARVRGFLEEIKFTEGSDVKKGDLLFVIEEEPFRVTLESARAQLDQAEASLKKAQESKAREIAAAQIAVQQAQLLLARVEEARQRVLLGRNAASQADVDRAEASRKADEAQLEAARANYEQSRADYDVNILAAQAEVEAAKSSVREAEINLGYCRMYAPIDGRIGEAQVKVGNLVGPAAGTDYTELATIQQLDPMGVDLQVSSRYLDRATELINKGLTVRLRRPGVEGEQLHSYPGKAFFIDNRIDPTTSTFLIKAEVPNPRETLLPGEYVKLDMVVGQFPGAVVVPERAVMEAQGSQMVYTIDDEGKVAIARVDALRSYRGLRVVTKGLEPGRRVIVEGIQQARPGMPVTPEPAPADALPAAWNQQNAGGEAKEEAPADAPAPAPAEAPAAEAPTPAEG